MDEDTLLRTFAPIVYLHPEETSLPAGVDWLLARMRLHNASGDVVLSPVGSVQALAAAGVDSADWYLSLMADEFRTGQGPEAPLYGTVREIRQSGEIVAYDLQYWFIYAYNGNIFDLTLAKTVLGTVVAAGSLAAFVYPPFAFAVVAAASAALAYVDSVAGFGLHEGDVEHATVRVDTKGNILGIYCAAHDGGQWHLEEVSPNSDSHYGYRLSGTRPILYSACQSHATYPYSGETQRLGGFGNDHTGTGLVWDPLDSATPARPMGRLVNLVHDVTVAPDGQQWTAYPGDWGNRGSSTNMYIEWFGTDLSEYVDGPSGPAQHGEWNDGDEDGPTSWTSAPTPLSLLPASSTLAMAEFKGYLCAVYTTPSQSGNVSCAVYNGAAWTQPSVPGLDFLGNSGSIAMHEFQGSLHAIFRVAVDLEWATLVIDPDTYQTLGWSYSSFPPGLETTASGAIALAVLDGTLYLLFVRERRFVLCTFDGATWTDVTPSSGLLRTWDVDGPIALLGCAGKLVLAFGSSGALRNAEWSAATGWADTTPASPARAVGANVHLAFFDNYIHLVYSDASSQYQWTSKAPPSSTWADDIAVPSATTSGAGALAVFPVKRFLALVFATPGGLQVADLLASRERTSTLGIGPHLSRVAAPRAT